MRKIANNTDQGDCRDLYLTPIRSAVEIFNTFLIERSIRSKMKGNKMQISAKRKDDTTATVVEFDLPADLDALATTYGADVVYANAKGAIVISLQSFIRRLLDKGKHAEEIQAEVTAWRPDVKSVVKQTAFDKASKAVNAMSAEERAQLLESLKAMAGE